MSASLFEHQSLWLTGVSQAIAQEVEALGYGSLLSPESGGKESMTHATSLLAATDRIVVGTGIANIYLRHAAPAEAASRTPVAMYPGRFVLGLGVSHAPILSRFGWANEKPLSALRDYLAQMNDVSDDIERGAPRPLRILAAVGLKKIELSGPMADGAYPFFVTPQITVEARSLLGPEKWLVPGRPVLLCGMETGQWRGWGYKATCVLPLDELLTAVWRRSCAGRNEDSTWLGLGSESLACPERR